MHPPGFGKQRLVDQGSVDQFGARVREFERGGDGRQRAAQFVGGVADETPLGQVPGLQPGEHAVHGDREIGDFVSGRRHGDPLAQLIGGDRRHPGADPLHRAQGRTDEPIGGDGDEADDDRRADRKEHRDGGQDTFNRFAVGSGDHGDRPVEGHGAVGGHPVVAVVPEVEVSEVGGLAGRQWGGEDR